ncbi:MAG: hypothetical protein Q7R80_02225 [bacterium]|nr:hypothetical protein [bacterium]
MWRYLKAAWYTITFRFEKAAKALESRPEYMAGEYDEIIREMQRDIGTVAESLAGIVALQEQVVDELHEVEKQIEQLEQRRDGALELTKQRVAALKKQGKTKEEIEADTEYLMHLEAYQGAIERLEERNERETYLEGKEKEYEGKVSDAEIKLKTLKRKGDEMRAEKHEAVADVALNNADAAINEALGGISTGGYADRLQSLRERRRMSRARAKVASKVSGADVIVDDEKYRAAARRSRAGADVAKLVGLDDMIDAPVAAAPVKTTEAPTGTSGGKPSGGLPG